VLAKVIQNEGLPMRTDIVRRCIRERLVSTYRPGDDSKFEYRSYLDGAVKALFDEIGMVIRNADVS
jgi:hypothetical protein